MKRDYPDRPIVGVGAVIVQDGRVLVVQRANDPLRGLWSIPGGVLELGETLRRGAAREVLEETGLVVEVGDVVEVLDSIYPDAGGSTQYHYVLVDFLCRVVAGELRAGSDVSDARWLGIEELASLDMTPNAPRVLRKGWELAEKQNARRP